ncbi:dienelactone hydrolase family protein [Paraglaciecola polaris]|uniref:dienelactone hydrolase family protein n=1 Tax=Paraglaciecola polaris TaxID=222814 RepID=UPI0030ECA4DE|tara:strand:+ start:1230 stop:1967 length:738 start_codon:yes stop_codon:yes gene_type:complete
MIIQSHQTLISTPTGNMQTSVYRPLENGTYPTIIFYSEIFQETAPITRSAKLMAGHGFVVLVPEVFHELNPVGTVLAYDDAGKDKGNADKFSKPLEQHDSDTQSMIRFIDEQIYCSGRVGTMGVCIGGHLAFRAALNSRIEGAFCLYPTDIHSNTLPCELGNDSLSQCHIINAELCMIFGKQDPHVSREGRELINTTMQNHNLLYSWHELNAQHAFMRDEGDRYDPAIALSCYQMAIQLFNRRLS